MTSGAQRDPTDRPDNPQELDMPQPKRVDSTADVEGAAKVVSEDLARDIRSRQESIAGKRRRVQLNTGLLQRRVQKLRIGSKPKR
jgi:hypothetical protein